MIIQETGNCGGNGHDENHCTAQTGRGLHLLEHTQEGHIIPESVLLEWFWVNVDLGMDFAGKDVQVNDGTNTGSWLVGNDGTLQLQVRHGQTIAIQDLPEGTQVTVTELTTNMRPIRRYTGQ